MQKAFFGSAAQKAVRKLDDKLAAIVHNYHLAVDLDTHTSVKFLHQIKLQVCTQTMHIKHVQPHT